MVGMFASSKAGHDKGTVYVILREEEEYVYVADGRLRTVDRPKKKKKKHIQIIKKYSDDTFRAKLADQKQIYDEEVRKAIGGLTCQKQM